MIIDTDFNILIFQGERYIGELQSINLLNKIITTSDGKEYNMDEVTAHHDISPRNEV